MGSVIKISEGKYRLFISDGRSSNGKRTRYSRTIIAASDSHAEKMLKAFEKEVFREDLPLPSSTSFSQLWELYMSEHVDVFCKPMTRQWYDECAERLLVAFGHMKVANIKTAHIRRYYGAIKDPATIIGDRKGGVSDETMRHHYRALRAVFNFAITNYKLIKENPTAGIKLPKPKKLHDRAFTDEELPGVLSTLAEEPLKWQALCMTAITSSMRREELVGLKWSDFVALRVSVSRAVQYTKKTGLIIDDTKTDSSVRGINLPCITMYLLAQWKCTQRAALILRIEQLKAEPVISQETLIYLNGLIKRLKHFEDEFVWNQYSGLPMLPHTVTSWWGAFIKRHDLPHITFHGTRHTSATISIAEGNDVRTVAGRLGHADPSTTLRVYAQALETADKKIADMWDKIISTTDMWHEDGTILHLTDIDEK